jgi:hypothetical protein
MNVVPTSVNIGLPEGGSALISKFVKTPAIPPNADIVLLLDTTRSMISVIDDVQANAASILSSILEAQPTAQLAVAAYKDVAINPPGFTLLQDLTPDTAAALAGIAGLGPGAGGGDAAEDAINALFQIATGAVSFRPGSSRVVVWIGDAPSHNPSNGRTLLTTIAALQAARIRVIGVSVETSGNEGLDATGQAHAITTATGGPLLIEISPDHVASAILAGLRSLPVEVKPSIEAISPELSLSFTPSVQTVTSGSDATFTELVAVGEGAAPGSVLTARVDFLLNGTHQPGFLQRVTNDVPKHASLLVANTAASDFHDAGTLSAALLDDRTGARIAGATVALAMGDAAYTGVTDADGRVSCTIVPGEAAGIYPIVASFAGDERHLPASDTAAYIVTREQATLAYTGPTVLENGSTITLSAVLREDGRAPIAGRLVTFTLGTGFGAQTCLATTDAAGVASCTRTVTQPLGAATITASFAGDSCYEPAMDSAPAVISAFPAGGTFVIGDATPGPASGPASGSQ